MQTIYGIGGYTQKKDGYPRDFWRKQKLSVSGVGIVTM